MERDTYDTLGAPVRSGEALVFFLRRLVYPWPPMLSRSSISRRVNFAVQGRLCYPRAHMISVGRFMQRAPRLSKGAVLTKGRLSLP